MENIIIFRNQLFKLSEEFITSQVESLNSFNTIYVGRKSFRKAPKGSQVININHLFIFNQIRYVFFRDTTCIHKLVKPYNPCIIHAHFGVDAIYALRLSESLAIPLVTTFHGYDATMHTHSLIFSGKPAFINYVLFRKELIKKGTLFICVSDFIKEKVLALGFPKEKVIRHYIGIDTENIKVPAHKVSSNTILHVARLVEKKGTRYLLRAFSKVLLHVKDASLVIIGDGILRKNLEKEAKILHIKDNVSFLGVQPHNTVMEWMSKSNIFTLPSITASNGDAEGLGMVLLEAASIELPVVATDHGGIPEVIINNETGYLVPEKDVDRLAEKLTYLLQHKDVQIKMGKKARLHVKEHFNLKKQTAKLEKIYDDVLSKKC